jgi:soluble lytic murein transglycosylase-like protein
LLCALVALSQLAYANTVQPDPELRQQLVQAINASDSFHDRFDAEVWLVDMSHRLKPFIANEKKRLYLLRMVHHEAARVKLPPELVLAVIQIESRFDRFAISKTGAQGLMQVMPFWLKEIGHPEDNLMNIHTNLRLGCTILKYYMKMEHNNLRLALEKYNGNTRSTKYSDKVLDALRLRWRQR